MWQAPACKPETSFLSKFFPDSPEVEFPGTYGSGMPRVACQSYSWPAAATGWSGPGCLRVATCSLRSYFCQILCLGVKDLGLVRTVTAETTRIAKDSGLIQLCAFRSETPIKGYWPVKDQSVAENAPAAHPPESLFTQERLLELGVRKLRYTERPRCQQVFAGVSRK